MRSSISHSDWKGTRSPHPEDTLGLKGPEVRGQERSIPDIPWLRTLMLVAATTLVLLLVWEVTMRQLGLHAGDLDDGRDYWAVERRKVNAGPRDSVVIIGDSRILFGTDLATWQRLTGRRPIQLARVATNAQGFLHDLATDEHFAGLAVIGASETAYFRNEGNVSALLNYVKKESPSQRVGHKIYKAASHALAFLDSEYTLFTVLEYHDWPERKGVLGPYQYVWKLGVSTDDRQTSMWDRIERDAYLRGRLQQGWLRIFSGDAVAPDVIDRVIAKTKSDIDRIRARGGEVVWVRPPSTSPLRDIERARAPREKSWDRLLRDTGSFGVHFEDYPLMQQLSVPDWSHLSRSSAVPFTDAYVRVLLDRVEWLKTRSSTWRAEEASDRS